MSTPADIYFVRHPLYVTTTDNHLVNLQVEVANYTKQNNVKLQTVVKDPQGNIVYDKTVDMPFNRKMRTNELNVGHSTMEISSPFFE